MGGWVVAAGLVDGWVVGTGVVGGWVAGSGVVGGWVAAAAAGPSAGLVTDEVGHESQLSSPNKRMRT